MALIGKIRQNFWLVLIVLGLALASFILMDVMGSNNGSMFGNSTTVGEVNGNKIDIVEFNKIENTLFSGNQDDFGRKSSVWDYLVEKSLVDENAEALGLGVSREELMDLQFGANLSPIIQNNFRNPQTGQVDRQQLLQFKQAIETGQDLAPQFREFWANQEVQIINAAKKDKINNLVGKAMYTPSWLAELINSMNTETATFEFVKLGFDMINDSEVTLTDEDYSTYLSQNKGKYTNESETRILDYIVFEVKPTAEDSVAIRQSLADKRKDFSETANDSLFAFNNGGAYSYIYSKPEDLQGVMAEQITNMEAGDIYGPYRQNGFYQMTKVIDKQIIPDSVEARHILRTVTGNDPAQLLAASKTIDSLMNVLKTDRTAEFDSLAIKFSQDPGSSFKGGELGTFAQGAMVPPFNNAAFIGSEKGGLYKVTTQFGVHLIEVLDKVYNNREPKYKIAVIAAPIIPSEETQNTVNDRAAELMRTNRTLDALEKAVEASNDLVLSTSKPLKQNDFIVGNLPSSDQSRRMVKFAYEAAPGEVAPQVFEFKDEVNYFSSEYVVAGLKSIHPAGLMSVEQAKASIANVVMNAKKGELLKSKISGTDLSSIASNNGSIVDTARNVSFNSAFIPGAGSEPKLVANVMNAQPGSTLGPIVGNNGIYMAKLISKTPSVAAANVPQLKKSLNSQNRSQVSFRLWDAIKKAVDIEDNRFTFF